MKRLFIPLILFLLLILEGVAIEFLPIRFIGSEIMVVPHWILMFLILVSVFFDQEDKVFAIIYGAIFGLLIDVVYTELLGIYMFTYSFAMYITHLLKRFLQTNIYMTLVMMIVIISIVEMLLMFVYSLVGLTDLLMWHFLEYRLIPTIIANMLFLLVMYPLFSKRLTRWQEID